MTPGPTLPYGRVAGSIELWPSGVVSGDGRRFMMALKKRRRSAGLIPVVGLEELLKCHTAAEQRSRSSMRAGVYGR